MTQGKLYTDSLGYPFRTSPLARHSDPVTSKEAAADMRGSARLGKLQAHALEMVRRHPGHITHCLADLDGESDERVIGRRLSELEARGFVRREGSRISKQTGKRCQLWWPVEESK